MGKSSQFTYIRKKLAYLVDEDETPRFCYATLQAFKDNNPADEKVMKEGRSLPGMAARSKYATPAYPGMGLCFQSSCRSPLENISTIIHENK